MSKYKSVSVGSKNQIKGDKNFVIGNLNKLQGSNNWVFIDKYQGQQNGNLLLNNYRIQLNYTQYIISTPNIAISALKDPKNRQLSERYANKNRNFVQWGQWAQPNEQNKKFWSQYNGYSEWTTTWEKKLFNWIQDKWNAASKPITTTIVTNPNLRPNQPILTRSSISNQPILTRFSIPNQQLSETQQPFNPKLPIYSQTVYSSNYPSYNFPTYNQPMYNPSNYQSKSIYPSQYSSQQQQIYSPLNWYSQSYSNPNDYYNSFNFNRGYNQNSYIQQPLQLNIGQIPTSTSTQIPILINGK